MAGFVNFSVIFLTTASLEALPFFPWLRPAPRTPASLTCPTTGLLLGLSASTPALCRSLSCKWPEGTSKIKKKKSKFLFKVVLCNSSGIQHPLWVVRGREGWKENILNLITRNPQQVWGLLVFSHTVMSDSLRPMNCSTPGLSVPHHLPKFAQGHVYCIRDAIQPAHPLTPSSPSALNLSQHQGLFQWVDQWWGLNDGTQQAFPTLPKIWIKTKMTGLPWWSSD